MSDVAVVPARPRENDESVRKAAVACLLPKLMEWVNFDGDDYTEDEVREHAEKVLTRAWDLDGYKLARDFERHGYEPDVTLVDLLDTVSTYVAQAHKEAVKRWVEENSITCDYVVGQKVEYTRGSGEKANGPISFVDHETASYHILTLEGPPGIVAHIIPQERVIGLVQTLPIE